MNERTTPQQGLMTRAGGMAVAATVHALFFLALVAGQPEPSHYLAQLTAAPAHGGASPYLFAGRDAHLVQTQTPERLHKGLTTC